MWLSPDCKHFSKAKGGKPVSKKIRGLAWIAIRWATAVRPRVIVLENVEEFQTWGPVDRVTNRPRADRKGHTFRAFRRKLERLGYRVEWRELRACDYGAPTIRKRLFLIACCDGERIVWPTPTHGKGRPQPWRTAAECIDWSIPCPSIFERRKPLAENTQRRIARGIQRYVIDAAKPFIVPTTHHGDARTHSIDEPMRTITGAHRGESAVIAPIIAGVGGRAGQSPERPLDKPYQTITAKGDAALVVPYLTEHANASSQRNMAIDEPLRTQCAEVKGGHFGLVAPFLKPRYGEDPDPSRRGGLGQAPRVRSLEQPAPAIVPTGNGGDLVAAFLAKHQSERRETEVQGASLFDPAPTIKSRDSNALVTARLGAGDHARDVAAFLVKYYGTDQDPRLELPLGTITTKDRFALVTVDGTAYEIVDIGMRMLAPRELYRAQGFPDSYRIDIDYDGKPLTKTAQVRMCGNSVCPPLAAAIVAANYRPAIIEREEAA